MSETARSRHTQAFYKDARTNYALAESFDDNLDRINLAHLSSITPLLREKNMHKQREDAVQRRRDQQFPTTIADFRMIRNKDVQVNARTTLLVRRNIH